MNGKYLLRYFVNKILSNKYSKRLGISFLLKKFIIFLLYLARFRLTGFLMFVSLYCGKKDITLKNDFFHFPFHIRRNTSDRDVFEQTFLYLDFDIYLKSVKTIMDIGANIGSVSRYFFAKYPRATIISLEPEESNYAQLVRNTSFSNQIISLNLGIWSQDCNLKLVNKKSDKYSFSFVKAKGGKFQARSIKSIMEEYGISSIDILKIDIEGSENELFSNDCSYWMKRAKVIFVEPHIVNGNNTETIIFKRAKEFGFSVQRMGELLILKK